MTRRGMPQGSTIILLAAAWVALSGCTPYFLRTEDIDQPVVAPEETGPPLVGDLASPWGLNYAMVEGVALVTNLSGTGSDPPPSPERDAIESEMLVQNVPDADGVLASQDNALVIIRALLPPGVQKGDRIDIDVRVPPRHETKSLRNGWMLPARLKEIAVLNDTLRTGGLLVTAEGPVIIDSIFEDSPDPVREKRGRVLGGGVALKSRPLALVLKQDFTTVEASTRIASSINTRFFVFDHGDKRGVAIPKTNEYVELTVPPHYRHNLARYLRVIRSIAVSESDLERTRRLQTLELELLEPTSAPIAAMRLEAVGKDAIPALKKGLDSSDPEVRFYSSEALAYLDVKEAAPALAELARSEPAFRWHAMTALAAMDHVAAYDALVSLLDSTSAETRYGAFRALAARNPNDPLVRGASFEGFTLHVVRSPGEPLIHFANSNRAQVVIFGEAASFEAPEYLFIGKEILLKRQDDGRIKLTRFQPGKDDRVEIAEPRVDDVIRAIAQLGGGYAAAWQAVSTGRDKRLVTARVAVDALPSPGRRFHRDDASVAAGTLREVATPLPELFQNPDERKGGERREELDDFVATRHEPRPWWDAYGKMQDWLRKEDEGPGAR